MTQSGIALIAGLGNPGNQYAETRHNVGFWFLERLQYTYGFRLSPEKKFKADIGTFIFEGRQIRIAAPATFMNLSGQSIAPLASFYRIPPEQILVVHDELDIAPGSIRLKIGGGHGGHNGLRDIIPRLGSPDFIRLRIGIGHPGTANQVSGYVLSRPHPRDRLLVEGAIDEAVKSMPEILSGQFQLAMNHLHTEKQNG